MKEKIIYQIKNKINGKSYIGSSINYKIRKKTHIQTLRKGKSGCFALQNAWLKYKEENFEWNILEVISENEDLALKEEEWILKLDTIKNGYNIRLPYTQQKFSGMSNYLYKTTEDWLIKNGPYNIKSISREEWIEKRKNDPLFKVPVYIHKERGIGYASKPVVGVDSTGAVLHEYPSISELCKFHGKKDSYFNKHLQINSLYNKFRKSKGLYWFLKDDFDKDRFLTTLNKPKSERKRRSPIKPVTDWNIKRTPITIQNIETHQILDFSSIKECSKFLESTEAMIYCLKRGWKNSGGGKIKKVNQIKGWKVPHGTIC